MQYEKLTAADFDRLVALEQKYKATIGEPQMDTRQIAALQEAILANRIEFFVAKEAAALLRWHR